MKRFEQDSPLADEYKLPWLINAFLYPISTTGLVHLAVFVIIPLLFDRFIMLVERLLEPHIGMATGEITEPVTIVFYVIFLSYVCYFLSDCVINSARGHQRAENVTIPDNYTIGDFISHAILLTGCLAICISPLLIYSFLTKQKDLWFWLLTAYGIFFLPMSLLRGIMFDTMNALNPIEITGSIYKTFVPYCALVLFFVVVGGFVQLIFLMLPVWTFLKMSIGIYLTFVLAHRFGWFYWWYKDKLDWGI